MIQRILKRVTDVQLGEAIKDQQEAQVTMTTLEKERLNAYSKQMQHQASETNQESEYLRDKKELESLQTVVPSLEEFLSKIPKHEADYKRYSHALYVKNRTMERLEEKLENTTAYDFLKDLTEYGIQEELVLLFDAYADRIGKWFESGAAGPGSITYNGKTYTSSAQ